MSESLTSNLGAIFKLPDDGGVPDDSAPASPRSAAELSEAAGKKKKRRAAGVRKKNETEKENFKAGMVTRVEVQQKNAARVSVFIDEAFGFGCFKKVWLNLGIGKGETLSEAQYAQLMDEEQRCRLQHYWMDLLSRRNHSAGELRRKALQKGYPEHHFDALIDDFRAKNFIDEQAYAIRLADEMRTRKRWGDQKIRASLIQKGLPENIIEQALNATKTDDGLQHLKELTIKNSRRLRREDDPMKRKKKLFDHLARKGHPPGLIMQHIDTLLDYIKEHDER